MSSYCMPSSNARWSILFVLLLTAGAGSIAQGQILPPAILYPASVTSGIPNQGNLVPLGGAPTGFSYTGNLYWDNVPTLGAILVMDMEGTLDPNWPPALMQLGATMSGTFDVTGTLGANMNVTPPDFVINSFSLVTSIEAAVGYQGPNPYPQAIATVFGPFHGGPNGIVPSLPYFVAAITSPFPYSYSANFPILRLRFMMNVDGMSIPGQFRIDFPAEASFTQVPEPSVVVMAGLGIVGLVLARRRRNRQERTLQQFLPPVRNQ